MAEVVVNITANTGQATDGVDNLNNALNQTDASAAALEATLKKQEASIKVLDGAINVLGGSVELLAGGLALSGVVTEEQARQFETAAIGAIAFADGAKRVVDGVKNLNEGLAASGGLMKTLNVALLANPAAITAAAIVSLGVAIGGLIYYLNQQDGLWEDVNEGLVENIKLSKEQIGTIGKQVSDLKFLESVITDTTQSEKTRNNALKELQKIVPELEGIDLKRADAIDKISQAIANEITAIEQRAKAQAVQNKLTEYYTRQLELITEVQAEFAKNGQRISEYEARVALQRQDQVGQTAVLAKEYQNLSNQIGDSTNSLGSYADIIISESTPATKADSEAIKVATTNILNYKDAVNQRNQAIKEGIELFIQETGGIEQTNGVIMRQLPMVQGAVEKSSATLGDYFNNLITKQVEFFESEAGKAASSTLSVASNLAKTLSENIDESNKEGFEKGKKYRIAETRITSIQAAFEAYKGLVGVPFVGQFLAIAGAAAALAAGQKAIKGIQSSTFGGSGAPSNPSGSPVNANFPAVNTGFQGGGQFLPNTAPQGTPPIRAYVVTGDVTNGQVAEQQLQTRRRFG